MCDDGLSARSHLTNPIRLHFSDHLLSTCRTTLGRPAGPHNRFIGTIDFREVAVCWVTFEFNGLTCGNGGHVLQGVPG